MKQSTEEHFPVFNGGAQANASTGGRWACDFFDAPHYLEASAVGPARDIAQDNDDRAGGRTVSDKGGPSVDHPGTVCDPPPAAKDYSAS